LEERFAYGACFNCGWLGWHFVVLDIHENTPNHRLRNSLVFLKPVIHPVLSESQGVLLSVVFTLENRFLVLPLDPSASRYTDNGTGTPNSPLLLANGYNPIAAMRDLLHYSSSSYSLLPAIH
jgi:hypothetical protein